MITTETLEAAARPDAARGSSVFERTILPDFARWFVERVAAARPDVFVPVETKGVHLLDAVLAYARDTLGTPLQVPVLYAPALAYVPREWLAGWRFLLLDDATRTGRALERHYARVERYGAADVSLLACVGLDDPEADRLPGARLDSLQCYRHVGPDVYRELVWQLAELVIARGLPPEVDHHVYRLSMPGSLVDGWATLLECLRRFGDLSVDGPVGTRADVIVMTLHFPAFPDAPRYALSGAVRDEGVKKLRLFADLRRGMIFVVPMAFPALTVPAGMDHGALPEAYCREVVAEWTGGRATVADTMVERACTRDADLLFRAASTATEVDLVCGFARVLGRALPDQRLALTGERHLFARLHGPEVGAAVADRIDAQIAAAFAAGRDAGPLRASAPGGDEPPVQQVDATVVARTVEIAKYLKVLSDDAAKRPERDPLARAGLPLSDLQRCIGADGNDLYLLSRCIDYGLAMMTLVPFTAVTEREDGSVEGRRTYGVSELDPFEDLLTHRRELEEETIALIARTLVRSAERWRERVPLQVVASTAAILSPMLARHDLALQVEHSETGPRLLLGDDVQPASIYTVVSELFTIEDDALVPTREFELRYRDDRLALDRRDAHGVTYVEARVRALAPLLDGVEDPDALLLGWATSIGSRMGLEVVERHLRSATRQLLPPLHKLVRGDRPDPSELLAGARRSRELIAAAQGTVDLLADSLAEEAARACPDPDREQSRMLESLATPSAPDALLRIARQTCEMAATLAAQVEALAQWPDADAPGDAAREHADAVAEAIGHLRRDATTLADEVPSDAPPSDPAGLPSFAAACVKDGIKLVNVRAAALAWTNHGVPREASGEARRRATVLAADLTGSTPRSVRDRHVENVDWVTTGLDLAAVWGRAFGGREIARNGDEVLIEFPTADGALLCGAVVQRHTAALRATGRRGADWQFRIAVDSGEITDARDNDVGTPINVATKLAKFRKHDPDVFERVLVTPQAAEQCSGRLREALVAVGESFDLDPERTMGPDARGMRFTPQQLDASTAVNALLRETELLAAADATA